MRFLRFILLLAGGLLAILTLLISATRSHDPITFALIEADFAPRFKSDRQFLLAEIQGHTVLSVTPRGDSVRYIGKTAPENLLFYNYTTDHFTEVDPAGRTIHAVRISPLYFDITRYLSISDDGRWLLSSHFRDTYRVNLRTGESEKILDTLFTDTLGTLSPDGKWIATVSQSYQGSTVSLMKADGTEAHELFTAEGIFLAMTRIRWSQDSQQIAIYSDFPPFVVYQVNLNENTVQRADLPEQVGWADTGEWVEGVFQVVIRYGEGANIYQIENGRAEKVVELGIAGAPLVFSPEHEALTFQLATQGIYHVDTARRQMQRLTRTYTYNHLWTPDGKWIVFSGWQPGDKLYLYRMRPDGSDVAQITREDRRQDFLRDIITHPPKKWDVKLPLAAALVVAIGSYFLRARTLTKNQQS